MFGFLRRSRSRRPVEELKPVAPPAAEETKEEEEPVVRSWFSSSLDLHKGLDISDAPDDTTEPMPLHETPHRKS